MSSDSFDDPMQRESLDLVQVLANAVDNFLSVTGGQLVAALAVVGIANGILGQSLLVQILEDVVAYTREALDTSDPAVQENIDTIEQTVESVGLTVDASVPVLLIGLLGLAVVVEAVRIVAVRAFASGELDGVSTESATRRLPIATAYGFIAVLVTWTAITVLSALTFFLLFIPVVFVYLGLLFVRQEIAIADAGLIEAISNSWQLTKGNRWDLLLLVIVLFVVAIVIQVVTTPVAGTVGLVVSALLGSTEAIFGAALVTEAYVQLRGDTGAADGPSI